MNHPVSIHIQTQASISPLLPDQFKNDWIPGSLITSAAGGFGAIAVQTINLHDISIHYIVAEIHKEVVFQVPDTASLFFLIIQMQGNYEIVLKNGVYKNGRHNACSLLFTTQSPTFIRMPKQERAASLVLAYPVSFITSVLGFYPSASNWKEKIEMKESFASEEYALSATLSEKVYGLLHTPFVPMTKEFYMHACRETVEQVFRESAANNGTNMPFDMHDISCIHAAKEYLDRHILEHPTIEQLSRKVGINRLKLKKGFKAVYGIGVYGYQLQQRMLIAKSALEKTRKPVHQIARQSGYKNTSNFSAAFKRVFGMSPYKHRHTQKHDG